MADEPVDNDPQKPPYEPLCDMPFGSPPQFGVPWDVHDGEHFHIYNVANPVEQLPQPWMGHYFGRLCYCKKIILEWESAKCGGTVRVIVHGDPTDALCDDIESKFRRAF